MLFYYIFIVEFMVESDRVYDSNLTSHVSQVGSYIKSNDSCNWLNAIIKANIWHVTVGTFHSLGWPEAPLL